MRKGRKVPYSERAVEAIDMAGSSVNTLCRNVDPGHVQMIEYLNALATQLHQSARALERRCEEESGAPPEPLGGGALEYMLSSDAQGAVYWVPKSGARARCRAKLESLNCITRRAVFKCVEVGVDVGEQGLLELSFERLRYCALEGSKPWLTP